MPDYDPRTATGIPTEPVGSLPRPSWLQQAYARYDAGEITREELDAEQDKAVADSIEHLEATGAPIISDGHNRQLPRLTDGPFRKSMPMAHTPMKQAVIAPSMLALLYPLDE